MSGVLGTQAYKRYFGHPTSYYQGAITASMPAGSLAGSLASSFLADRLSRKVALQVSCVLWIVGSTVQCAAQSVMMLCVGRAIAGMCVGIASSVVPVYQVSCGGDLMFSFWWELLRRGGRPPFIVNVGGRLERYVCMKAL